MNEECLICKAPIEYLNTDEEMKCENITHTHDGSTHSHTIEHKHEHNHYLSDKKHQHHHKGTEVC